MTLFCYLEELRLGNPSKSPKHIKNYIFSIRDFGLDDEITELLESSLFSYSFNSSDHSKYIVFSYYTGIVIATVYRPENIIVLDQKLSQYLIDRYTSKAVKELLKKEIIYQVNMMIKQKAINDKVLDAGLGKKINDRYKNVKKIK